MSVFFVFMLLCLFHTHVFSEVKFNFFVQVLYGIPTFILHLKTKYTLVVSLSITDLHTPVQELTRLVNIYSIPWEQRSEALKKLHTGNVHLTTKDAGKF